MKKVVLMVAVLAVMVGLALAVSVVKHTSVAPKVDSVATMVYGVDGGGYNLLSLHERSKSLRLGQISKNAMKLRPVQKIKIK